MPRHLMWKSKFEIRGGDGSTVGCMCRTGVRSRSNPACRKGWSLLQEWGLTFRKGALQVSQAHLRRSLLPHPATAWRACAEPTHGCCRLTAGGSQGSAHREGFTCEGHFPLFPRKGLVSDQESKATHQEGEVLTTPPRGDS